MKYIIKAVLFIVILAIIMGIISFIFIPKNNTQEAGMTDYGDATILAEPKNTIDMIIFGNSEAFTSVIPMKLWEDYGYTSYICGHPGQTLPDIIKVMNDVTKNQNPKVIVLEANAIYDNLSLTVPISKILQAVLPVIEYRERWKSLKPNDFLGKIEHTQTSYMKGFHYRTICQPSNNTEYMQYTEEIDTINWKAKIYLNIINDYCKKNDTKLIIICAPSSKNWSYARHNGTQQYANEKNIPFIDFNTMIDELGIDWQKDTLDGGDHMNFYGSIKLTNYFGKYLNEQNILPNHKEDIQYSKWNEDLELYKEEIKKTK